MFLNQFIFTIKSLGRRTPRTPNVFGICVYKKAASAINYIIFAIVNHKKKPTLSSSKIVGIPTIFLKIIVLNRNDFILNTTTYTGTGGHPICE